MRQESAVLKLRPASGSMDPGTLVSLLRGFYDASREKDECSAAHCNLLLAFMVMP